MFLFLLPTRVALLARFNIKPSCLLDYDDLCAVTDCFKDEQGHLDEQAKGLSSCPFVCLFVFVTSYLPQYASQHQTL